MSTAKVAITIDEDVLAKLDRLVKRKVFASRSQAIQEAISDKLEQVEQGEQIAVHRERRFTSEDIHRALFPKPPKRRTLAEMKEGIRRYVKERHARG
jgi:Arc/MetJ-type ribon-helix-helix transcriptional regulator